MESDNDLRQSPAVPSEDRSNHSVQLVDRIARVAHEANRAYCHTIGDDSQLPWDEAPEWQKQSSRLGVIGILEGRIGNPGDAHRSWLEEKERTGWRYGPVKDPEKKLHPCFIPFRSLPWTEQLKDFLFVGVVRGLSPDVPFFPGANSSQAVKL